MGVIDDIGQKQLSNFLLPDKWQIDRPRSIHLRIEHTTVGVCHVSRIFACEPCRCLGLAVSTHRQTCGNAKSIHYTIQKNQFLD